MNEVSLAVQRGILCLQLLTWLHVYYTQQYQTIRCRSAASKTDVMLLCHLMAELKTEHNSSYFGFKDYFMCISVGHLEE